MLLCSGDITEVARSHVITSLQMCDYPASALKMLLMGVCIINLDIYKMSCKCHL